MNTFYIIRHGETENNKAKRFSGWIDTPLTEQGIEQAHAVAAKLKAVRFDTIVSSDLGRAFTTAYLISRRIGYTGEIERLQGFREMNYGQLANQPYGVYPELPPLENAAFVPPEGESLLQMQTRVLNCLRELDASSSDKTILIAGHDGTINAVRESYTHETMGAADTVHNPHDSVWRFTVQDGQVSSFEAFAAVAVV